MRIISGHAGGLAIQVPKSLTRPTTDKVRQAVFNMLGDLVPNSRVLDLFAGSGAMGLEALSRGAASALFIDEQRAACEVIRGNLTKTKLAGGEVRSGDALRTITELAKLQPGSFDLLFADPPYQHERGEKNWAQMLVDAEALPGLLSDAGAFVLECSQSSGLVISSERWHTVRDKVYGDTRVLLLRPARP
jgi:16S rRNA (guanine966-N2)-methyltransferase